MKNYIVIRLADSKIEQFDSEFDAWTYIGEMEHNYNVEHPELIYKEVSKIIATQYKIYESVIK